MLNRSINLPLNNSFFLFGPRLTGKSTLLHARYPDRTTYYYDLLKTEEYLRLLAHPSIFREEVKNRPSHVTHIIVDEIQKVPLLLNEIHLLMESPKPPFFVLTGSSARKLKRTNADMLGGRAFTYRLFPFNSRELGGLFSLQKALQYGTLPAVYLEESSDAVMDKLRSYVDTYLKEEIEAEAQVRQLNRFVQFLTMAAFENGGVINFSNIARETGTSYQTVKSYFQILEDTLVGRFVYPFLKSQRKRLSRHPKFYFFDTGVVRALTRRLAVPLEPRTQEFGRAFEHFVFLETISESSYLKNDFNFSFYRTESGAEVDLIIESPRGDTFAVEIKATDTIDSSHLKGLKSFEEIWPDAKLACVCNSPRRSAIGNITVLPWQELFEWLILT